MQSNELAVLSDMRQKPFSIFSLSTLFLNIQFYIESKLRLHKYVALVIFSHSGSSRVSEDIIQVLSVGVWCSLLLT